MPSLEHKTQFLSTKGFTALLVLVVAGIVVLMPQPVKLLGLLGVLGIAGVTVALLAVMFHPLAAFALYFGTLFFAEASLPGIPVSANQVFAPLFLLSVASFILRGKAQAIRSGFLPVLIVVAVYFSISALTGQAAERGLLHARYVLVYLTLALSIAAVLTTETSILALAWIVVILTAVAAVHGLAEAAQQDILSGFTGKWSGAIRVKGAAKNSVVFGWNMVFAFPFAFLLFSELRARALRWLALGLGFFVLFVAVLTFNRQTFLAIALSVALSSLLFAYHNRKLLVGAVVAVGIVAALTVLPMVVARLMTVQNLTRDISYLERRDSFLIAKEMFVRHPAFGVGLGSYPIVWKEYLPPDYSTYIAQYNEPSRPRFPDFGFMQILSETGLMGLALLLTVGVVIARRAWIIRRQAAADEDWFVVNYASMILVMLAFAALTTMIQDTFLYVRMWIMFGLALLLDRRMLFKAPPSS